MNAASVSAIRRTAVCVVRAEPQGSTLLFSVTGNTDIERYTLTQVYGHALDRSGTLDLVRRFLEDVDSVRALDQSDSLYLHGPDGAPQE